jgi:uncharacterized NAD-dependent epimerase/dehydratase family protein
MKDLFEGNAVVYCEGAFGTSNGKTAHGLVRRSRRYRVTAVIDSAQEGKDAGQLLDGVDIGIPIYKDLYGALDISKQKGFSATHFIVGLAPDGGRLSSKAREDIIVAINSGLDVDSGLHDFLSEDQELCALAREKGVKIRDVRKPPSRHELHFFSGKIEQVSSFKVAVLGTDSAVGKRTTAWMLVDAFDTFGIRSELIGTGQTAWLQGSRYGIILDSLVCDFVSGEIEHSIWTAWKEQQPEVIVLEGQGSLLNPAYPGGFELLAAGRPDVVVLQHAPNRLEYDGLPGYKLHPLDRQIQAIEIISGKPVVAISVNHEGLSIDKLSKVCEEITKKTGRPTFDVLYDGAKGLADVIMSHMKSGYKS